MYFKNLRKLLNYEIRAFAAIHEYVAVWIAAFLLAKILMIDGFVISRSQALHSLAASPRLFTHSPLLLCTPYFNVARKYTHGYPISIDNAPRKYPIQKLILSSLFKTIRVSLLSGRVCQQATVDSGVRESPYIIRLARYQTRPPAIGLPITAVPG